MDTPPTPDPHEEPPVAGHLVPTAQTLSAAVVSEEVSREHLHRRMLVTNRDHFEGKPEIANLYEDLFANLVIEASAIPGFGLAQEMLLERIAYVWAEQKRFDNLGDPVSAAQYEKLIGRYTQLLNALFRSRSDRADEAFMRTFIGQVVRATRTAVEEELHDQPTKAVAIVQSVVDALRAEMARSGR